MHIQGNQKGFTLIEALVAIGIFSIGFLAVASMQISSLNQTTSLRITNEAIELASGHAEFLHSLPFYPNFGIGANVNNWFDDHPDLAAGTHINLATDFTDRDYTIRWVVTDLTGPSDEYTVESIHTGDPVVIFKTVAIQVFETRNPGRILSEIELIKVCEQDVRA